MLSSLSTFNQVCKSLNVTNANNPYGTASYRFVLNNNLLNTGILSGQTININTPTTFEQKGGKTAYSLLLTDDVTRIYLAQRLNLPSLANAQGSYSVFVYPVTMPNDRYLNYIYYNVLYTAGVETTIFQIQIGTIGGVKTPIFNFGNAKQAFTLSETEFALNTWTHICVTWSVDSTQSNGTVKLYLNGNLKLSVNVTNWNTFSSATSTIGNYRRFASSYYINTGNGVMPNSNHTYNIANLAYWNNKELNTSEINFIISNFT